MLKQLLYGLVGGLSTMANKKATFINYAKQFLKQAPVSYAKLQPHLPQLIDKVFEYSKTCGYELADEVDLIEGTLYMFVKRFAEEEIDNLPVNGSASITEGFRVYRDFLEEYPIK